MNNISVDIYKIFVHIRNNSIYQYWCISISSYKPTLITYFPFFVHGLSHQNKIISQYSIAMCCNTTNSSIHINTS